VASVVGVFLTVGIAIVVAALIGGVFLQLGTPGDRPPETSFEADQRLEFHRSFGGHKANFTVVEITHAGGEAIDVTQFDVMFRENTSVWGIEEKTDGDPADFDPAPDFQGSLGTEKTVEFAVGDSMRVTHYEGIRDEYVGSCQYEARILMGNMEPGARYVRECSDDGADGRTDYTTSSLGRIGAPAIGWPDNPATGDPVNVVWRSESGDETQLLYRYVVGVGPQNFSAARATETTTPARTEITTTGGAEDGQETAQEATSVGRPSSDPIPWSALAVALVFGAAVTLGVVRYRRGPAAGEPAAADGAEQDGAEIRDRAGGQVATAPQDGGPPDEIPTVRNRKLTYDGFDRKQPIGRGGNADVYRVVGTDEPDRPTLALKEPRFEGTLHQETVDRFVREAETWERLDDHDHIVGVIDWDTEPLPWIAMEYMDAGDLAERSGDLSFPQAVWTAGRIADGVRHAHDHGVIHLDLKPSNVLLRESGAEYWDVPKIGDWGLAKLLLEHSKSVEELSPEYAAPEQFDPTEFGGTDKRTDIYQLGSIFYELFVGEPAFSGPPASVLRSKLDGDVTPPSIANPALPAALDDVLLKGMAIQKADRYDSVVMFRNELRDLLKEF
jgi:tRNA A-37 threonylcarbamoyl transferase component Bud32